MSSKWMLIQNCRAPASTAAATFSTHSSTVPAMANRPARTYSCVFYVRVWDETPATAKGRPDFAPSSARSRGFPGSGPPGNAGFQPAGGRRPAVVHAGKDARDPRNAVVPT